MSGEEELLAENTALKNKSIRSDTFFEFKVIMGGGERFLSPSYLVATTFTIN